MQTGYCTYFFLHYFTIFMSVCLDHSGVKYYFEIIFTYLYFILLDGLIDIFLGGLVTEIVSLTCKLSN